MIFEEVFHIIIHIIVTVLAFTLGWIFWKGFRRSGDNRMLMLMMVFILLAIDKTAHLLIVEILGFSWFEAFDSRILSDSFLLITLAVLLYVIASGPAWRSRLKKPAESSEELRKAA